jgi:HK97 family phage major capsid protein
MASQVEKMREKAEGLLAQAEAAIQAGEISKGRKMIEDAQELAAEAKSAQDAVDQLKALKGEFNRPTNDVPVVTAEREMDALNIKRADGTFRSHTDANYVPSGYIKGLSPAIQPTWVREKMGANLKNEADFYAETFKSWFSDRSVNASNFWRTASAAQVKAMQENTDNEGGYFVPEDYRANVIHNPGAPGGLHRPYCTVVTTGLKDGYFPTFGSMTWAAIAEEASYGDNTPTVGQVSFTVRKSGGTVKVSAELLEDAQANLPALLAQIASEAAGRYEDQQIIEGDGTTEPEGIRTSATDGPATAANNAVTVADFLAWYFDLPAQFRTNAAISTSSSFLGYLAGVGTTAAGVHLLSSLRENPEGPIAGKPVVAFDGTGWDSGAAIGASEELGCIGDWRNYYLIDRVGMSVTRDDSVYRANDQVGFFMRKRGDGRVGLADAFRIFKVKA